MTTGDRIRFLRERKGLTQAELGGIVGVEKAAVWKWEHGKVVNLKKEVLLKLSDLFQVSVNEIVGNSVSIDQLNEWEEVNNHNGILQDEVLFLENISKRYGSSSIDLLSHFMALNEAGQQKALDMIQDLLDVPKYRKDEEK